MANILTEIEIAREQVAACRKMCAERWENKGCPTGHFFQCMAFHECCRLLRDAEQKLRDLEKRRNSYP